MPTKITHRLDQLFDNSDQARTIPANTTIYKEGEPGDFMYVVLDGTLEIIYKDLPIATLERGDVFGEMALLDQHTRIATVRAITDAKVVPIDKKRFHFMVQITPHFATEIMEIMAERIRILLARYYESLQAAK